MSEPTEPKKEPERLNLQNKTYWINTYQKTLLDANHENINQSAEKLEKLILWLWGIYSPIVGIGTGFIQYYISLPFDLPSYVILFSPIILLIFAYYYTTKAQSGESIETDIDSLRKMREHYFSSSRQKNRDIKITRIFVGLSCFLIPVALLYAARQIHKPKPEYRFESLAKSIDKTKTRVSINGVFPKETKVVFYFDLDPEKREETVSFKTLTTGSIQTFIDLNFEGKTLKVRAEWEETKDKSKAISQIIQVD